MTVGTQVEIVTTDRRADELEAAATTPAGVDTAAATLDTAEAVELE